MFPPTPFCFLEEVYGISFSLNSWQNSPRDFLSGRFKITSAIPLIAPVLLTSLFRGESMVAACVFQEVVCFPPSCWVGDLNKQSILPHASGDVCGICQSLLL